MKILQVHQARPAQVLQAILCPIQMMFPAHPAHRHQTHRLHLQAAAPNRQIHPAQVPVQVLNPLTVVKNTINQNLLP